MRTASKKSRKSTASGLTETELEALVLEATVDAYGDAEEVSGLYTMIEEHLRFPFTAEVLGVTVTVRGIEFGDDGQIVAVCVRGRHRQRILLLDLPLPSPPPPGSKWIHAYRRWCRRGCA